MSETAVAVGTAPIPEAPAPAPDEHLIGEIEKPKATSDAPSPAAEAPREPKPETVALVEPVVPTFEMMMRKPVRRDEVDFMLPQENSDPVPVKVKLEAIDGPAYDALQAKYPPNAMQRARGNSYDPDKFGPALLERVVKSPSFTMEQWTALWSNPRWSGGELASLFWSANNLCLKGLDVPFSSSA